LKLYAKKGEQNYTVKCPPSHIAMEDIKTQGFDETAKYVSGCKAVPVMQECMPRSAA